MVMRLSVLLMWASLTWGCVPRVSVGPPQSSTVVQLPSGAYAMRSWSEGKVAIVTYMVNEPFPGENARTFIERELIKRGWTLRLFDLAGQLASEAVKWITIGGHPDGLTVRLLTRYWEDRTGDVFEYVFSYRETSESSTTLEVLARHLPQEEARQVEDERRRMLEHLKRTKARPSEEN